MVHSKQFTKLRIYIILEVFCRLTKDKTAVTQTKFIIQKPIKLQTVMSVQKPSVPDIQVTFTLKSSRVNRVEESKIY